MTDYVSKDQIVSPLNVLIPMAMLSYGTRGDTTNNMLGAILFRRSKTEMAKHGLKALLKKLAVSAFEYFDPNSPFTCFNLVISIIEKFIFNWMLRALKTGIKFV